jgi:serine/threonine protein kinase
LAPPVPEPERPTRTAGEALGENLPRAFGRYTLLDRLGSGAVGVTFVASDLILDRIVALKVPHSGSGASPPTRAAFRAAQTLATQFGEPHARNVRQVFDRAEVDGCPSLATAYVTGERLDAYWRRERHRLGPSGLADLMHRVARTIARVNQALPPDTLAHGNLKPGNVLICPVPNEPEPRVVILDYGLVPAIGAGRPPVVGEAGFAAFARMPPEQLVPGWNGHAVTEQSDVYSLGMVLYELISGELPFPSDTWERLRDAVLNGYVWPPSETTTGFRAFDEVCLKATARNPADRYWSLGMFAEALAEVYLHSPWPYARSDTSAQEGPWDFAPPAAPPAPVQAPLRRLTRPQPGAALSTETVLRRFPTPIALAYQRFLEGERTSGTTGSLERVYELIRVFEAATSYLTFLALSDLLRPDSGPDRPLPPVPADSAFDFTRHPRPMWLGRWLQALRAAIVELKRRGYSIFLELVTADALALLDRLESGELMSWLVRFRHGVKHGGHPPTAAECADLLRQTRPHLNQFLSDIAFVCAYPLGCFTRDAGVTAMAPEGVYRVHSWMGAGAARGPRSRLLNRPHPVPTGIPFVLARNGTTAMCLWPFLAQRYSSTSRCEMLYTFQQIDEGGRWLNRVKLGSVLDPRDQWKNRLHELAPTDHNWLFDALARLPQLFTVPAELELSKALTESG